MNKIVIFLVGLFLAGQAFAADMYTIDPAHSSVNFTVKHMMISRVPGQFKQVEGAVAYSASDLANSKITVTIPVASVDTANEKRDGHIKSPDFFDAAKFPTATFVSKSFTAGTIVGDLTIKGVTKEVTVLVSVEGPVKGMDGKDVIGITGGFSINRQDYGITWNKAMDKGGVAVSNEVALSFSLEAHQ